MVAAGEPGGLSPWTLPVVIATGLALTGMAWLTVRVRIGHPPWKVSPPARRRRSPARAVLPSSNGSRAVKRPTAEGSHLRDAAPLRLLLVTEGSYPFRWGGLSTWCHSLIRELPEVEFSLIAMSGSPGVRPLFERPPNLVRLQSVPLWGVRYAWESDGSLSARTLRQRRRRTTDAAVRERFVSPFSSFVEGLLGDDRDDDALVQAAHEMYTFFREHDFDTTFRSRPVWLALAQQIEDAFPALVARSGYPDATLTVGDVTTARQWLYHWLFPLAQPIPEVEVAHAAMAGICSLVAAVARLEHGSAIVLSEHGIYLRERYLAEHSSDGSLFGKLFKLAFARRMTEVAYAFADVVAPCCDYNQRWERRIGVDPHKLRTAYYGLDPDSFPAETAPERDAPVVVWAGRIQPLKDLETLLHAAAVVHAARPDVRFRLFGNAQPEDELYHRRCLALHAALGLEDVVSFEGFTDDPASAYAQGDLVVLSSISEGFPYSTLEAMICGKPIVATAVGGIAEQISEDCGVTVRPRDPAALGAAIVAVFEDMEACSSLARAARDRASSLFTLDRFKATHRLVYQRALNGKMPVRADAALNGHRREPVVFMGAGDLGVEVEA